MKILAKHQSLKNLIQMKGWGLVGTNEYSYITKAHLLDLRSRAGGKLVFDVGPTRTQTKMNMRTGKYEETGNQRWLEGLRGQRIQGSEWNSNFYGVSFDGLVFAMTAFPEMREKYDDMLWDLFHDIFNNKFEEWERRL
jgi:hypothetical protein